MELQITGKNIDLSLRVRRYVERKLGRLSRHLPNIVGFKVEIEELNLLYRRKDGNYGLIEPELG